MYNLTLFFKSIIKLVKPTKMIFLAIDGVPMRAKLDKQRKKRFERLQSKGKQKTPVKQDVHKNVDTYILY